MIKLSQEQFDTLKSLDNYIKFYTRFVSDLQRDRIIKMVDFIINGHSK